MYAEPEMDNTSEPDFLPYSLKHWNPRPETVLANYALQFPTARITVPQPSSEKQWVDRRRSSSAEFIPVGPMSKTYGDLLAYRFIAVWRHSPRHAQQYFDNADYTTSVPGLEGIEFRVFMDSHYERIHCGVQTFDWVKAMVMVLGEDGKMYAARMHYQNGISRETDYLHDLDTALYWEAKKCPGLRSYWDKKAYDEAMLGQFSYPANLKRRIDVKEYAIGIEGIRKTIRSFL